MKEQQMENEAYQSELEFYKLKSKADSLMNNNEESPALELYTTLDSITNGKNYTRMALEVLEVRKASNNSYSKLSDKLDKRGRAIRQLLINKSELNDSLHSIKVNLGVLQHEYDSILVLNSHVCQKMNELNDSINANAIKPMDALAIVTTDSVDIRYIGEVKQGKAQGFGYAIFDKKGFYEGYWNKNLRNGNGKYTWQNGDFYEGKYFNGLRNGFGTYHFSSGEQYIGQWQNDLRHGHGVLLAKNGKVLFKGEWIDNEPHK